MPSYHIHSLSFPYTNINIFFYFKAVALSDQRINKSLVFSTATAEKTTWTNHHQSYAEFLFYENSHGTLFYYFFSISFQVLYIFSKFNNLTSFSRVCMTCGTKRGTTFPSIRNFEILFTLQVISYLLVHFVV